MVMNKAKFIISLITGLFSLSSCSSYSSKFVCNDSRGMPCAMMRSIDKKIDSGEINKAYISKCKGQKCREEEQLLEKTTYLKSPKYDVELINGNKEDELIVVPDKQNIDRSNP